jgi:vancomycin resistance protein YoaR
MGKARVAKKSGPREKHAPSSGAPAVYIGISGLVVAMTIVAASVLYQWVFSDRIFLGVTAMGVDLGGYTSAEARVALSAQFERYLNSPLAIKNGTREWRATPRELGLKVNVDSTVQQAFEVGRSGPLPSRLGSLIVTFGKGTSVTPPGLSVDAEKRSNFVRSMAKEIDSPAGSAQISIKPDQKIVISPAKAGYRLNVDKTEKIIDEAFQSLSPGPLPAVVDEIRPALAEADLTGVRTQAELMLSSPMVLRYQDKTWKLERPDLANLIDLQPVVENNATRYDIVFDEAAIKSQLERIAKDINTTPQNPRYVLRNEQATQLKPGVDGRDVDVAATIARIKAQLSTEQRSVDLVVKTTPPAQAVARLSDMQFPDVLERASTVYGGTMPDRMYNIELAAQRLNGTIILPGEVFSFNDAVGEVSLRSGYKQGYGITQSGNEVLTIPSEGGGICQVATTVFQAAFWSGMPVVERNWHLYWIPRYGQPPKGMKGLDATIDQIFDKNGNLLYEVDLQWKNSTPHPVALEVLANGENLTVALRGTRTGWKVTATEPKIEKVVKADPKPVYQSDASLARGAQIKIEQAEDGFQATVARTVTQDGKVIHEQRFVSTYRPSRNVFLVGGPVPAATTPTSNDRPANPGTPQAGTTVKATPPAAPAAPATPVSTPRPAIAPPNPTPAQPAPTTVPAAIPSPGATPADAGTTVTPAPPAATPTPKPGP